MIRGDVYGGWNDDGDLDEIKKWENGSGIFCKDYADGRGEITKEKWAEWTCPNCGWFVGEQYIPIHHNQRKSNYCPKCGQAIQWENLEEMEDE